MYDPENGDYPVFPGDQAVFMILNDIGDHSASNHWPMAIEMHVMIFSFDSSAEYLTNTIFMNYKVINRSGRDYSSFKAGFWSDFHLGNPQDDYMGCDTLHDIFYVYNADAIDDETSGPNSGFGNNPPAVGVKMINDKLDGFMVYDAGISPRGVPDHARGYYNLMSNVWNDGSHLLIGGNGHFSSGATNTETNFIYSGNPYQNIGWTELSAQTSVGNRRGIGMFPTYTLLDGECQSYMLALSFGRNPDTENYLENISHMTNNLNEAETFIINHQISNPELWLNPNNCTNAVGVEENTFVSKSLSVYPNPSNGTFKIQSSKLISGIEVYNYAGQRVESINNISGHQKAEIELFVSSGIYLVKANFDNGDYEITKIKVK